MHNREIAPRATTGAPGDCDVCSRPDSTIVEFFHPHRVICATCLKAANEALKGAKLHVVYPLREPYTT